MNIKAVIDKYQEVQAQRLPIIQKFQTRRRPFLVCTEYPKNFYRCCNSIDECFQVNLTDFVSGSWVDGVYKPECNMAEEATERWAKMYLTQTALGSSALFAHASPYAPMLLPCMADRANCEVDGACQPIGIVWTVAGHMVGSAVAKGHHSTSTHRFMLFEKGTQTIVANLFYDYDVSQASHGGVLHQIIDRTESDLTIGVNPATVVGIYDMFGNSISYTMGNGEMTLKASCRPQYLVLDNTTVAQVKGLLPNENRLVKNGGFSDWPMSQVVPTNWNRVGTSGSVIKAMSGYIEANCLGVLYCDVRQAVKTTIAHRYRYTFQAKRTNESPGGWETLWAQVIDEPSSTVLWDNSSIAEYTSISNYQTLFTAKPDNTTLRFASRNPNVWTAVDNVKLEDLNTLIVNGDFEDWPGATPLAQSAPPGWTWSGGNIYKWDSYVGFAGTGSHYQLLLARDTNGTVCTVSQTFTTVAGRAYVISFDTTRGYDNVGGTYLGGTIVYNAANNAVLLDQSQLTPAFNQVSHYRYEFIAASTQTKVQLISLNPWNWLAVDNVLVREKYHLVSGDVNDDGVVDWTDLVSVLNAVDRKSTDVDWDYRTDMDVDYEISSSDLAIVLSNLH